MATHAQQVSVDVRGLELDGPTGRQRLGDLTGTWLVVLMRHRH